MPRARKISAASLSPRLPCCRCQSTGCRWDQVAGKPICPDCQEALAQGQGDPLVERTEKKPCVVCGRIGTLRFVTFPLDYRTAVEMDLCGDHVRSLIGRRLNARAFQNLRGQLQDLGLRAEQVFLLHEAFYDRHGRALQPAREVD
jgi:hypothetical protein